MGTKNSTEVEELRRRIMLIVLGFAAALSILLSIVSCTSSKRTLNKDKTLTEEKIKVDSSSYWKDSVSKLLTLLNEERKEHRASLQFQEGNNNRLFQIFEELQDQLRGKGLLSDSLQVAIRAMRDSLQHLPCISTLESKANGDFKATGLKSADLLVTQLRKQLLQVIEERESEINRRIILEQEIKEFRQTKTVEKKRKPILQFFVLCILAGWLIVGWFFPPKGLLKQVKNLFIKKPTV